MQQRFILIVFFALLFAAPIDMAFNATFEIGGIVSAQEYGQTDDEVASPFAISSKEKEQLLDKAEEALKWFKTLSQFDLDNLTPTAYREHILPLEAMQAAAILKENGQSRVSRQLRDIFPYFKASKEECFEISERLGNEVLESFKEDKELTKGTDSATLVQQGTKEFLDKGFNSAERFALIDPPETVPDLMKAINLLAVSGRPMLVRYYLAKLLEAESEPKDFADLIQQYGSRSLMRIASNKNFAPQGTEAVSKIFDEARKYWQDSDTVSDALDTLEPGAIANLAKGKPLPEETRDALQALWRGNRVSARQLIDLIADSDDDEEVAELLAALLSLGGDVKDALAEIVRAESAKPDNPKFLANAARGLIASILPQESFLLYPLIFSKSTDIPDEVRQAAETAVRMKTDRKPTLDEAISTLYTRAADYSERNRGLKVDSDGYVRFWNWDEKDKKPKYVRMLIPSAYRLFAYRYARTAWQISPEDGEVHPALRRFYLAMLFDRAAYLNGRDISFDPESAGIQTELDELGALSPAELEKLLGESLDNKRHAAAQIATILLGRQLAGKPDVAKKFLNSKDAKPRTLVRAVASPDRRVRFAALETLMSLKPDAPYPGSSHIAEALDWFARADGRRLLVSAYPKVDEAAKRAGFFIESGYQSLIATTGKQAMQLAAQSPDVELLLYDTKCRQPIAAQLVQEMRIDNRTHDIPIAVLSDDEKILDSAPNLRSDMRKDDMQRIDRLSSDNPFKLSIAMVYPPVIDDNTGRRLLNDLFDRTGAEPVPPDLRLEQARKALGWLKEIVEAAKDGPKIYQFENFDELLHDALYSDVRLDQGLELASVVDSATAQAGIYEVVASNVYPMEIREKAADSFERNIKHFGIRLRGKQVQRLYDCYNASSGTSEKTQELLARMIDLIEDKVFSDEKNSDK